MPWTQTDTSFKKLSNKRITTSTGKGLPEEKGASTLELYLPDIKTGTIPGVPPNATTDILVYTGSIGQTLAVDTSVPGNLTWFATSGYGNTTSANDGSALSESQRLGNWISDKYDAFGTVAGAGYEIKVYDKNSNLITKSDSSNWLFDYQTGILIFNNNVTSYGTGVSTNGPYRIVGHRYVGPQGIIPASYGGLGFTTYNRGDILVGAGTSFFKLTVGADNYVLTASSSSATGITWSQTAATGLTTLNSLTSTIQYFAVGYSGSTFDISSSGSTHTFNIPIAGSGSTGLLSTQTQTIAGQKTFTSTIIGDLSGTATTAQNLYLTNAISNSQHSLIFSPTSTGSGVAVSSNTAISFNPSSLILYTSGLAVTATTVSTSSSTGALIISGGVGIGGSLYLTSSVPSNLSGVVVNNSIITSGSWAGSTITGFYGGTGYNSYTKGDILVGAGNTFIKLPVGTDNYVLTASSSTATGLTWSPTAATGITTLNTLTATQQYFATGTTGNSFNISSSGSTHTFNIPLAGTGVTGFVSPDAQTIAGQKTFTSAIVGSLSGTATTAQNLNVVNATTNSPHYLHFSPNATGSGVAVSSNTTVTFNPSTFILSTSGLAVTANTSSTSSSSGALVISGGVGIGGSLFVSNSFASNISNVVFSNGVVTSGTWAGSSITSFYGGTGYQSYSTGDLIAGAGTTLIRVALGTNNFVLVADSTVPGGIKWANVSGIAITNINGLTVSKQDLAFGYTGTVPAFSSSGSTHTLNIPVAGTGATGLVSTQSQSFAGIKTFTNAVSVTDATGSGSYTSGALVVSGGVGIGGTLNVQGDLNVQGTFTTINSTTITVADKNIELGVVGSPSDVTAQGGGITLRGATDKSINWYSGVGWSSSESWNLASGNTYKINGTTVLSSNTLGTGVIFSSIQTAGIITSGTWSATAITALYGGTGLVPSFTVGDILYANTSSTWARLAASSNSGYVLASAGAGATPSYVAPSTLSVGSATTSSNINIVAATSGTFFPVLSNTSSTTSGIGASVSSFFSFNAANGAFGATSVNILSTQSYNIGGNSVLSSSSLGTGVTNSYLTAVGTITTGVWSGTSITALYGGTGYQNYTVGDLLVGAGSTLYRLPVGSNNFILTADSTAPGGVKWSNVSGLAITNINGLTNTLQYFATGTSGTGFNISSSGSTHTFNIPIAGTGATGLVTGIAQTFGGAKTFVNDVIISSTTGSTAYNTGALTVYGGLGVSGQLSFNQAALGFTGANNPTMSFIGSTTAAPITLTVLSDNSLVFEGTSGKLFGINNNLSSGWIFNVGDISGLPIIRANADGTIAMAEFAANVGIGLSNPSYKLHVAGDTNLSTGYVYRINGTQVLSSSSLGTGVTNSYLTAVGTITTGVWAATAITSLYGGTGYSAYTTGDLLVGAGSTLYKLPVGTNNYVLTADNTAPGGVKWSVAASTGVTTINSLTASIQYFSTGTSGSGFNISSSGSTHTFNIPIAGTGATGLVSTLTQSFAGVKTFTNDTIISSSTVSTSSSTGALTVTGGAGIGGSLYTAATSADSISGVVLNNGVITSGSWSATAITARYGGTGNTSYTLGDLLVGAGSTFIKLPVGINSYVLGADSSKPAGLGWTTVTPLTVSDTAPTSPKNADLWFNSLDGGLLVYYNDGNSNQWVEIALGSGIDLSQALHITNTTSATSTSTGALIVDGGAGFASTIYAPVVSVNGIYDQISSTLTTSTTTADQVAMTLSATTYRTIKLFVQVTSSTSYHSQEILMVHDGSLVYMTEYAIVNNGSIISTFDADISGGNIRFLVTPTNAVTTYKVACSAMRI